MLPERRSLSFTLSELRAFGIDPEELAYRFTLTPTDKARLRGVLEAAGFELEDEVLAAFMGDRFVFWQ